MLQSIGVDSIEQLFDSIPDALRLGRELAIPPAMSEMELTQHVSELAGRNQSADDAVCFLGGGSYDHFIPSVVDAISSRSEYYTAYTPYQAEASQGSLQAFFEFQTMICQLTGMTLANASLYEGGSSVTEAVLMAMRITGRMGKVIVPASLHPEYRTVLSTYLHNLETHIETITTPEGFFNPDDLKSSIDDQTACVVVQHPNFFGYLEEVEEIGKLAHEKGALFVVSFDPISLGLLKRPRTVRCGHCRRGGAMSGQSDGLRRTVSRHPRLSRRVCEEDTRKSRRRDDRSKRKTLLGPRPTDAGAAHSP